MSLVPAGYLFDDCRGLLRHSWHEVPSDWTPEWGVPFTLRCERCNCERRDTVHRTSAEVLNRRYIYPPGYAITGEEAKPRIADFRLEWLLRQARKASE